MSTSQQSAEAIGVRPIPEFAGVHDTWPRGARLERVREAAREYKRRFEAQGEIHAVASVPISDAAYLSSFSFHGAAKTLNPYVTMTNRMVVIQYQDFEGRLRTLVFEPTEPDGSIQAPFYAQLAATTRANAVLRRLEPYINKIHHGPTSALQAAGIKAEDVDYITFDHLHVQHPTMILEQFPHAKLLVQRKEVGTFESLHPMQWAWYVDGGLDGVDEDRIVLLDGDVELGPGISLIWTPGHTDGNHSLCINTPEGVWVSSENGVAADNWQPQLSKIPGVRRYAEFFGREICPNANTLEDSLDQYDSMVKEKTLADNAKGDPRWLQVLPSSELVSWRRQWPVIPTYRHGGLRYGTIVSGAHRCGANGSGARS